ncbi:uncharacterized protein Z518_07242 [Rhinocladiella mackenziei CBS 650.93]|uniref:Rhinocladiella mackenziei CBS 650.93 unplaced genomic scaffold supercont1.5, whole genome shotgun sequence n=1 Tax=Rhinocladiella mackenziei CBS 650.93 TaxID=1442369 RepID=A0A0D2ICV8_9EURO|nr:uncharacterized protein Z518_07242 [Rhinocladiella mackenziei CBS 650.93]KIX03689.1 hypothetical protein Z518_07242 [Rhinocladiella mackenziei CBS 650.93]
MYFDKLALILGSVAIDSLVLAGPVDVEKRWGISYGNRGDHVKAYQDWQSASYDAGGDAPSSTAYNGYNGGSNEGSNTASASNSRPPQQTPPFSSAAPFPTSDSGDNPFIFPLSNGFPNIASHSSQLNDIENQAHGTLPNGPPPPNRPADDDLTSLRLIAFNELWEVAFFTELLTNITQEVPGYQFQDQIQKQTVIDTVTAVQAQEELHLLNANGALDHFKAGPIQPCQYIAGVDNFQDAIMTAATFTDVVLGTLGDVQTHFGDNGDSGLIGGVAAVIGQEGEQNGFYRNLLHEIPSAAPFLTASTREFAFSALNQNFVVQGSCPNINTIDLPVFGKLNLLTKNIQAQDQTLQFSFSATGQYSQWASGQGMSLVYINQQNVPVVEPLTQASTSHDGTVTFSANFPFVENKMFGLTIAAVVQGSGPFNNVTAVADAAKFGPALIEID